MLARGKLCHTVAIIGGAVVGMLFYPIFSEWWLRGPVSVNVEFVEPGLAPLADRTEINIVWRNQRGGCEWREFNAYAYDTADPQAPRVPLAFEHGRPYGSRGKGQQGTVPGEPWAFIRPSHAPSADRVALDVIHECSEGRVRSRMLDLPYDEVFPG